MADPGGMLPAGLWWCEAVRAFSHADGRDCGFRGKSLGIEVFHVDDDGGVAGGGFRSATKRFTRLHGRLAGLFARRCGGRQKGEEVLDCGVRRVTSP